MVEVTCNLCGRDDPETVSQVNGARFVRCAGCGLVYLNPRPADYDLRDLYAEYHSRNSGNEISWSLLMRDVFGETARLLEGVGGEFGLGRLLDVGCGFGDFALLMQTKGWRTVGLDPSENAVAASTRKGIPVSRGTLEAFDAPAGTFNAVTMFYVLEHLPDPMGALKKAYELLLPGGTLIARVPHTTPIVRMLSPFGVGASLYDAPYHLYDFSPSVLGKMLRKAGYEEVCTFPGKPTCPTGLGARFASRVFGELARGLYTASGGRFLLPGVSKTTIARKPV